MYKETSCPFCNGEIYRTSNKLNSVIVCLECNAHKDYEPHFQTHTWYPESL